MVTVIGEFQRCKCLGDFGASLLDPSSYPTLQKGSKGSDVIQLQTLLSNKGYGVLLGTAGVDGDFGNATVRAVMGFQIANGLTPTGIVDSNLWSLLFSDDAAEYSQAIVPQLETVSPSAAPRAANVSLPQFVKAADKAFPAVSFKDKFIELLNNKKVQIGFGIAVASGIALYMILKKQPLPLKRKHTLDYVNKLKANPGRFAPATASKEASAKRKKNPVAAFETFGKPYKEVAATNIQQLRDALKKAKDNFTKKRIYQKIKELEKNLYFTFPQKLLTNPDYGFTNMGCCPSDENCTDLSKIRGDDGHIFTASEFEERGKRASIETKAYLNQIKRQFDTSRVVLKIRKMGIDGTEDENVSIQKLNMIGVAIDFDDNDKASLKQFQYILKNKPKHWDAQALKELNK